MTYAYTVERYAETLEEMTPIYRQHYQEMADRLAKDGIEVSPFNPRFDAYINYNESGDLMHFLVRKDGKAVAYANVYVTRDMHNQDLIAQEDAIYVIPEHRNGIGRILTKKILAALKSAGVKRAYMTAVTDPRATHLWKRLGFRETGSVLTIQF